MGQGVIALGFKDKHTPSPLRGTPPASGGERRTGAIALGEKRRVATLTQEEERGCPSLSLGQSGWHMGAHLQ